MIRRVAIALLAVALLASFLAPAAGAHYVPMANDHFAYYETINLTNGQGGYLGYTENTFINGSITVNSVLPNGTENTSYQSTTHYENNTGASETSSLQGSFTFSAVTFHYVQGTDNQTGYSNPFVWFLMNNSLGPQSGFYLLNTHFTVVSTNDSFPIGLSATGYVRTIFAEGNGSYQNYAAGGFNATYNWKAYFDPATGYIVGYVYTEQDDDGAGDTFTITDTLTVTATSYALTAASAPPSSSSSSSNTDLIVGIAVVLVVLVLIIVVVVLVQRRSRLARHAVMGNIAYDAARPPPAAGPSPPPLGFGSVSQPSVQQVIIKETVKVNCRYCGTLIDSTATVCPSCGASRT